MVFLNKFLGLFRRKPTINIGTLCENGDRVLVSKGKIFSGNKVMAKVRKYTQPATYTAQGVSRPTTILEKFYHPAEGTRLAEMGFAEIKTTRSLNGASTEIEATVCRNPLNGTVPLPGETRILKGQAEISRHCHAMGVFLEPWTHNCKIVV